MVLNPKASTPLYQQVADILRGRITEGTYGPGSKLPSESELIEELASATRPTIRRGLAILVQEGLTESRQGKGVFRSRGAAGHRRPEQPVLAEARAQARALLPLRPEALGLSGAPRNCPRSRR
ncbi:hypothetical protein Ae717Ps2_6361 [Pseudonocardia sp. Ae717_Ps2]|uniref:GntR family transcriptional regulator n=1 Tax=Pseudonocardia sp. Ae717_Ps2 TaxID=1885573 RepID=UPI00094B2F99|nr:GntR family transcriptional regulator [Pseudonocardia sp. Ae717_Ps2]OLM28465.1 hypothetical protein Ae717Ps2_6361 [Pseudonocardia sp. Ae717_Ps2]